MTAYIYRQPSAFKGRPTRLAAPLNIDQAILGDSDQWTENGVGQPVVFDTNGKLAPVSSTTTATDIVGVIAALFGGFAGLGTNNAYPPVTTPVQLTSRCMPFMRWGYIGVQVQNTTVPVRGGQVYVRITLPSSNPQGLVIGGFEAAADSTNTIAVPGWTFQGSTDSNGITEIYIAR